MPSTEEYKILDVFDPCHSSDTMQILWKWESQKNPTGKLITFYLDEKRWDKVGRAHKAKEED